MKIVVWGGPTCSQCKDVVKHLDDAGADYEYVNAMDRMDEFLKFGTRSVPVITQGSAVVMGYKRPIVQRMIEAQQ